MTRPMMILAIPFVLLTFSRPVHSEDSPPAAAAAPAAPAPEQQAQAPGREPQTSKEWTELAATLDTDGDHEHAVEACKKAIALDPKNAFAYYIRGNALKALKRPEDAAADFTKAIKLDPKEPNLYIARGALRGRLGDSKGQIEDLSKAIKLAPKEFIGYYLRANAYDELAFNGQYKDRDLIVKAEKDFVKTLELAPQDWPHRAGAEKNLAMDREMEKQAK